MRVLWKRALAFRGHMEMLVFLGLVLVWIALLGLGVLAAEVWSRVPWAPRATSDQFQFWTVLVFLVFMAMRLPVGLGLVLSALLGAGAVVVTALLPRA